ncbi:MAG: FtsX-like permease family protein [bacterium]|nr:FtsX-like permease family protein [bacterium]
MSSRLRKPLRFAAWLIKHLAVYNDNHSIKGDIEELYYEIYQSKSYLSAIKWYLIQTLVALFTYINFTFYRGIIMLKSYLKIAFRNFWRYKSYSFINVGGFAIGMTCCIYVFLWVNNELSYDNFHNNRDLIYRVLNETPNTINHPIDTECPPGIAAYFKANLPEVSLATRFHLENEILIKHVDKSFYENHYGFADPDFFVIFDFHFIKGDPATALSAPNSIVLTDEMSKKYFGEAEPLGKLVTVNSQYEYIVTGIIEDIPENSHLQFDSIIRFDNILEYWSEWGYDFLDQTAWFHFFQSYIMIKENVLVSDLEEKIPLVIKEKHTDNSYPHIFHLQQLKKIHLHSTNVINSNPNSGDIRQVYFISLTGILVLLIACINFVNLTTARSGSRAKEVGTRKVLGAVRSRLIKQFYSESILYTVIALLLALCLTAVLQPVFHSVTGNNIAIFSVSNFPLLTGISLVLIVAGILSGLYPALILSAFRPIQVLKGSLYSGKSKGSFRKLLVVVQFSCAICLIICAIIVADQFRYIQNRDLGYNKNNMLFIRLSEELKTKFESVKSELTKNPEISGVTISSSTQFPGNYSVGGFGWEGQPPDQSFRIAWAGVGKDFIETLGMEMVEGRSFSEKDQESNREVIINESAAKIIRNTGVESIIGLEVNGATLIGVVKDYHFNSMRTPIAQICLMISPERFKYMLIRISPDKIPHTINYIETVCANIDPDSPVECHFMDELFDNYYRSEQQMGELFNWLTIFAILVACLGLFGLSSFTAESRTKEIGIRKVLGSSVSDVLKIISMEFIPYVLIANIFAWPASYYFMNKWLQNFAYSMEIDVWIFLVAGLVSFSIAVITVSYKSIKASFANPVDSLRYE